LDCEKRREEEEGGWMRAETTLVEVEPGHGNALRVGKVRRAGSGDVAVAGSKVDVGASLQR
jgi:hypothetical protein